MTERNLEKESMKRKIKIENKATHLEGKQHRKCFENSYFILMVHVHLFIINEQNIKLDLLFNFIISIETISRLIASEKSEKAIQTTRGIVNQIFNSNTY